MKTYLISFNGQTSEWKNSFEEVQSFMNDLEKIGTVSNITVSEFIDNKMTKSFNYNYNGESWEKR